MSCVVRGAWCVVRRERGGLVAKGSKNDESTGADVSPIAPTKVGTIATRAVLY